MIPRRPSAHLAPFALTAALVLIAALALAACGSSSGSSATTASLAGRSQGIEFATCMRANGVPSFPDPSGGGGIQLPNGINPFSPSFKAARSRCARYMPAFGGGGQASASEKASMLALSRCMRLHGVTGFPDPVSSAPSGPGFALAFGRPGAFIVVPSTIDMKSPVFEAAAKKCDFPGA